MIVRLAEGDVCTGCSACRAACPRRAIEMKADAEGFLHPVVDAAHCVGCGACARACPVLHPRQRGEIRGVWAAKAVEDAQRRENSSGGVFPLLAKSVLAEGGVVFGARWEGVGRVVHDAAESEEGVRAFYSSKYLQSDMGDAFARCRAELAGGRRVLFTGTPCQISGLKAFLGREYGNLLAVQVICHSVPSPLAWRGYLASCARQIGAPVASANCRDKTHGWKLYEYALNGGTSRCNWIENPYSTAFMTDLSTRPSCSHCAARGYRSGADLTIGDFWFIWDLDPEMDDDKGTSVVLAHTERGEKALETIRPALTIRPAEYANALRFNPALEKDAPSSPKRTAFFGRLAAGEDFPAIVKDLVGEDPLKLRRFVPMLRQKAEG